MGVYVFRCVHGPYVKVGHHKVTASRPNVYYRVAGRGFYACVHPRVLDGRLGIDDLSLVAWYPSLTRRDEGRLHRACPTRVGEFHPLDELPKVLRAADALGPRAPVPNTERTKAIAWAGKRATTTAS